MTINPDLDQKVRKAVELAGKLAWTVTSLKLPRALVGVRGPAADPEETDLQSTLSRLDRVIEELNRIQGSLGDVVSGQVWKQMAGTPEDGTHIFQTQNGESRIGIVVEDGRVVDLEHPDNVE